MCHYLMINAIKLLKRAVEERDKFALFRSPPARLRSCCFARHPVPAAWNSSPSSRGFQGWEIGAFLRTSWWWIQVLRLGTAAICTILFASIYDVQISPKLCGCPIWKLPYTYKRFDRDQAHLWFLRHVIHWVKRVPGFRLQSISLSDYNLQPCPGHFSLMSNLEDMGDREHAHPERPQTPKPLCGGEIP